LPIAHEKVPCGIQHERAEGVHLPCRQRFNLRLSRRLQAVSTNFHQNSVRPKDFARARRLAFAEHARVAGRRKGSMRILTHHPFDRTLPRGLAEGRVGWLHARDPGHSVLRQHSVERRGITTCAIDRRANTPEVTGGLFAFGDVPGIGRPARGNKHYRVRRARHLRLRSLQGVFASRNHGRWGHSVPQNSRRGGKGRRAGTGSHWSRTPARARDSSRAKYPIRRRHHQAFWSHRPLNALSSRYA